jgi:hypothetical protein
LLHASVLRPELAGDARAGAELRFKFLKREQRGDRGYRFIHF